MKHHFLLAIFFAVYSAAFAAEAPVETKLVTDFSSDLPADDANVAIGLRLEGVKPRRNATAGSVTVMLQRRGGQWVANACKGFADYYQKTGSTLVPEELKFDGDTLSGTLKMSIAGLSAGPGDKPTPAEEFVVRIEAKRERSQQLTWQVDPTPFMPPWRKSMPRFGGDVLSGTYQATVGKEGSSEGKAAGAVNWAPVVGTFGPEGNIVLAKADGGGVRMLARLAPHRVAAPEKARIVKRFREPCDWSKYAGLRVTVESKARRLDAAGGIWVRESDGAWYGAANALPLLGRSLVIDIPFGDFRRTGGFDANYFLDLDKIDAVALGVDDPRGVGDVEMIVRKVELIAAGSPLAGVGESNVTVDVNTVLSINGTEEIPKGLFGFHDVRKDMKPPEGAPDVLTYTRQINPGYFRPLDHVGWGGASLTDEQIKQRIEERLKNKQKPTSLMWQRFEAGNAVDNIVWCHTVDLFRRPAWMDTNLEQFLGSIRAFYRDIGSKCWVPGDDYNVLRRLEVWNEPFMWGRHMNMGAWTPAGRKDWQDPTQFGYLPGKVGAEVYSKIFLAAAEAAKSANPHVLLGGPSAPGFPGDDYADFSNYVRHFVDACHDKIDFLTEHHYQGEPEAYAASYVVVTAYADTKYQKRYPVYNTEANDLVDTPTKGEEGQPPAWSLKADELNRAHYNIQDILTCIRVCPDIAKGRAMHALWNGYCRNAGETDAYTVMAQLRGKMLAVKSSDPAVVAVASTPADGTVVVFLFNNSIREQNVTLALPAGFEPQSFQQLVFEDGTKLVDQPTLVKGVKLPEGSRLMRLASRSAARWTFTKAGYAPSQKRTMQTHYSDVQFARVAPGKPAAGNVRWIDGGPVEGKQAFLRVVTRGVPHAGAVANIGSKEVPLPWSSSNDGAAVVQDVPIEVQSLGPQTKVKFQCAEGADTNGYTVYAAAIVIVK